MKGGEDQRYIGMREESRQNVPRWRHYPKRIFRRKIQSLPPELDIERGREMGSTGEELMREEILEEVEEQRRSIDQQVDAELGLDRAEAKVLDQEIASLDKSRPGSLSGVSRRRWTRLDDDGDADDEGIDEDDIEEEILEARD